MQNILINFTLAKAIYSENMNYLDTFAPFVLNVIHSREGKIDLETILDLLYTQYKLVIPNNTLRSILVDLKDKDFISFAIYNKSNVEAFISEKGKKEVGDYIEDTKEIQRRHNSFYNSFKEYSKKYFNEDYEIDFITTSLENFISKQLTGLTIFSIEGNFDRINIDGTFENCFLSFLKDIDEKDPTLFQIFNELLRGSILWSEIRKEEFNAKQKEKQIEPITIYLDSNYLFSLLGLHHPSTNDAAKQLHAMLIKNNRISLRIFNFTILEMFRLLDSYKFNQNSYTNIQVYHIFYFLKKNNYDNAQIDLLKINLQKELANRGIGVVESEEVTEKDSNYQSLFSYYNQLNDPLNPRDNHAKTIHDASVLKFISRFRGGSWSLNFENCKHVFLTSSYLLDKFCRDRLNKEKNPSLNSFPETILDLKLTNILWLKNPKEEVGLSVFHLISMHSKKFLIDNNVWKRFISILKQLRTESIIDDDAYAKLISNNQLTETFLKSARPEQITKDSILALTEQYDSYNEQLADTIKLKENEIADLKKVTQDKDTKIEEIEFSHKRKMAILDEEKKKDDLSKQTQLLSKEIEKYDLLLENYNDSLKRAENEFTEISKSFIIQIKGIFRNKDLVLYELRKRTLKKYIDLEKYEECKFLLAKKKIEHLTLEQGLFKTKKIILCENQNDAHYNNLYLDSLFFIGVEDSKDVFFKLQTYSDMYALRDRDYLTDLEIETLENKFKHYRILRYYSFENYLYHPDNIAEAKIPNLSIDGYIKDIISFKESQVETVIIPKIVKSREGYEEIKREELKVREPDVTALPKLFSAIRSNNFEEFYKHYDMKKTYKRVYLQKHNIPVGVLASTKWFRDNINQILKDLN